MRVLQIADHYPPDSGGLASQVQRITERLLAAGHEAMVLTVGESDLTADTDGLTVYRRPHSFGRIPGIYQPGSPAFHPPWPDPEFRRGVREVLSTFRPDVIHVHGWSVFSVASLSGGRRPPIVCSLHDYGMVCPKKSLLDHGAVCRSGRGRNCLRCDSEAQGTARRNALATALAASWPWLQRRVFRFLAVSSYVRARHLQSGLDPERVAVIPPLIDAVPDGAPMTRRDSRPYVLYVGPGDEGPHKGRSVLLRAFERINALDHGLVLVGGREPVQANGSIEDAGYLRGEALAAAFRGASIVAVPSIWADPCPAVAVEGLSAGHPVVASATGGLPDIVEHEQTGLLVPPGNPNALAEALERLIADAGLRARLGERARGSIGRYTTEAVLPALLRSYREATA